MKKFLAFMCMAGLMATLAAAADSVPKFRFHELDVRSTTVTSPEPLRSEDFSTIDPGVLNPHLERWALGRVVELRGLAPRILAQGAFGVLASALESRSEIHLRPDGPWYQPLESFPCASRAPSLEFATRDGTRRLAENSARVWDDLLVDRKLRLTTELARISSPSEAVALEKARRVFREWLAVTDSEWRAHVATELEPEQWSVYRKAAESGGGCGVGGKANSTLVFPNIWPDTWMTVQRPPPVASSNADASATATPPQPLFRAPTRRFEGYYTIRLDLRVGLRTVSGQFLIDPSSPHSVVSPAWLIAQGVQPNWIEVPEAMPAHVRVRAGDGATGLAKTVSFSDVTASGYTLAIHRFQLFEISEIFDEPESPVPCCSGILGQDFLSRYVIDFDPENPSELRVWPASGHRESQKPYWVELRRTQVRGQPPGVSDFVASCSPRVRAYGIPKLCDPPAEALRDSIGSMIFDVPNGRLWYSEKEAKAPIYHNQSGLRFSYDYVKKDRALVVKWIGKTPGARQLAHEGLRVGDVILEVDAIPASHLDLWEVNRRLAGVYGDTVTLKWSSRGKFKVSPFSVILHETVGDRNSKGGEAQ
jgi:hypothetical protein